jgi:hypothetical protein
LPTSRIKNAAFVAFNGDREDPSNPKLRFYKYFYEPLAQDHGPLRGGGPQIGVDGSPTVDLRYDVGWSPMKIFYSWQSDLPNKTNRGLVQHALVAAAGRIAGDRDFDVTPVIDRDVQGNPGAPDIAASIFDKIMQSDVFAADVSIVHACGLDRTPNPNVLVELGFAVGTLGWERVLLVVNEAYGAVTELRFDLRQRLALTYRSAERTPTGQRRARPFPRSSRPPSERSLPGRAASSCLPRCAGCASARSRM